MRILVIVVLAALWCGLAYRSYSRGDMMMAGIFLAVGVVLTAYRLTKKS
jgi:hypothetical protein